MSSSPHTCAQCGLVYASGGVRTGSGEAQLRFCCSGCAVTYTVIGSTSGEGESALFLARLGVSAFLSMNIMAVSWMIYDEGLFTFGLTPDVIPTLEKLLFVLSLPVMLLVGVPYARAAWRELRTLSVSTDSLIAFGSFSAFFFSTYQLAAGDRGIYYDTATMTLVLVTLGRFVEARAKEQAHHSLTALMELQPRLVRVVRPGGDALVDADGVHPGERIRILPGERVPLDGVIAEGTTSVDASALTGESLPRSLGPGDRVLAATLNIDGSIVCRVTAAASESVHMQAVRLLDEARASRSPIQQTVDRISAVFLPAVILGSVVTALVWMFFVPPGQALITGLTLLVVACPCALGIGTPLAMTYALNRSAREGILVRSHAVFERLEAVRSVMFDKTGTLTEGRLTVRDWFVDGDAMIVRSAVASLEAHATHPVGRALFAAAGVHEPPEATDVRVLPGRGIAGTVRLGDERVRVSVIHGRGEQSPEVTAFRSRFRPPGDDETEALVLIDGHPSAVVYLADTIRPEARSTVEQLKQDGLSTGLLSGDAAPAVQRAAREAGVDAAYGELLPADKLALISQAKEMGIAAMVGDGINDAPSLAAADVGVAMAGGSDIAKEQADVVVVHDRLAAVPWLIGHARRTMRVIRWNLFWAFGYNGVAIAMAVAGLLQPVWAAAAMVVSSVSIIAHSRQAGT